MTAIAFGNGVAYAPCVNIRPMKSVIYKRRQLQLDRLIEEYDGQEPLAHACQVSPGYISQLLNGYRPISEKTARKIEAATGKPDGWMDDPETSGVIREINEILSEVALKDDAEAQRLLAMIRAYLS